MRASLSFFFAALLVVCSSSAPHGQGRISLPPFKLDVKEHRLANGVTVLVVERPAAGRVAARVFYRSDIAGEKPGTYGLTHLLEHYLFKGSHVVGTRGWEKEQALAARIETIAREITDEKNRIRDDMRQRDVFKELEANGTSPKLAQLETEYKTLVEQQDRDFTLGTDFMRIYMFAGGTGFTASTGSDWMKFDIDLPANRLELFMWMERDRVTNPVFRQFDPEREVVIEQIRRGFNDPQGAFQRMLNSTTYEAHPYGTADWFSDLQSATREDHWEIFYKYFIPQNTVIVVVGDVKAADVNTLAEQYFGDWKAARPSPRLRTVEPTPAGPKRVEAQAPAGPTYALNVLKPALGHTDGPALDVLAELLGGADGVLTKTLVNKESIATNATANSSDAKYSSTFSIRVTPRRNEDLQAVESGVDRVLRDIAAGRVTPQEIEAAVLAMHFDFIRGFEEIGPTSVTLGLYAVTHRWEYLAELPRLWAAVTPADLARVVIKYFDPQLRTTGILKRGDKPAPWVPSFTSAANGSGESAVAHAQARSSSVERETGDQASTEVVEAGDAPGPRLAGVANGRRELAYEPAFLGGRAPRADVSKAETSKVETSKVGRSKAGTSKAVISKAETQASPQAAAPVASEALKPLPGGPPQNRAPLAVAEHVWYAPPWMVTRGGSGAAAAPATASAASARASASKRPATWRALKFPAAPFTPPDAAAARSRTNSGVTAFIEEDAMLPMVRVTAYVDATTVHDPAGKEGLAALTAELLDRGGAAGRTGDDIRNAFAAAGTTTATDVTAQRTRVTATLPVTAQDQTYTLIGTMLTQPSFDNAAFERARANAAIRADRQRDATAAVLQDVFNGLVYGEGHPFVRHATKASIESITLDDVKKFHAAHYTADRITLAISGQVGTADVTTRLNAAFAKAAARASSGSASDGRVPPVAEPKPAPGLTVKLVDRPSAQAQVIMGYPGIAGVPDDDAALEIMHYVLAGGGFASRMMDELRTSRGLTAALYGEVKPTRFGRGSYAWRFGGNPDTIAEAIKVAFAEIEKMRANGLTPEEFERARTAYLEGNIPHAYDFAHARVSRFAQHALWGFYEYTSEQYLNYYAGDERQAAAIRGLTLADVNAAAKKYLRPNDAVIAIVGPVARIQKGAASDTQRYVTARE